MERERKPAREDEEVAAPVQLREVAAPEPPAQAAPAAEAAAPTAETAQQPGAWEADAGLLGAMGLGDEPEPEADTAEAAETEAEQGAVPDDAATAAGGGAAPAEPGAKKKKKPKQANAAAAGGTDPRANAAAAAATPAPVQRKEDGAGADPGGADAVHGAAADGISGASGSLPHLGAIQQSFGGHDVSGVQAHTDGAAADASAAMGAEAYATGDHVAFGGAPSLHTAAHEAAHVVQQRAGVHLKGGVGEAGDSYERHADAVADRVVAGESATDLLDQVAPAGDAAAASAGPVQRQQVPPQNASTPPGPAGPLDGLRTAVDAHDAGGALTAYQALDAAAKVRLRTDQRLLVDLLALLDRGSDMVILGELALDRRTELSVAARARPDDPDFLGEVLGHLGLRMLSSLAAAADDIAAFPAFQQRMVLDPIINDPGANAMQQLGLATTAGGERIIRTVFPGMIPSECLIALGADVVTLRGGFEANPGLRRWLLEKPDVLESLITTTLDGANWARAMWTSGDVAVLNGWVNGNPTYWGQTLGDALMAPAGGDAAALRASRQNTAVYFAAIAQIHQVTGLVMVMTALGFTLAEQVKSVQDIALLDATTLTLVLDGPGIGVAEQDAMTDDMEATNIVFYVAAGQLPHMVLSILAGDPAAFARAFGRNNGLTVWIASDPSLLTQEFNAVVADTAWIDALRALNRWELVYALASDASIQARVRAAILSQTAWNWLVSSGPQPLVDLTQVATLLALYGDGTGIALADKYATWAALYRTPLKRVGDDWVWPWTEGFIQWEKRYITQDPNDDAMNLFFFQFRQLPRAHVDTATAVAMASVYHFKGSIGSFQFFVTDPSASSLTIVPAPGHLPVTTSYYMGNNWIIMQSQSGGASTVGTPNVGRITTFWGSGNAVNTPSVDPLSGGTAQNLTLFQNHATHEVGHAVGNRTLNRGTYSTTGDDWAKGYGNWVHSGTASDYAAMLEWPLSMDATAITLTNPSNASQTITTTGAVVKAFLTGIVSGGVGTQATHAIATAFGGVPQALSIMASDATIGTKKLVQTVQQAQNTFPADAYYLPVGIGSGVSTVTLWCTRWDANGWVQMDAAAWTNRVSHYGVSSYKEMFAEMYTAKFTSGTLPPANNGKDPADFFNNLQQADPTELGLPAYSAPAASPGASERPREDAGPPVDPSAVEMGPNGLPVGTTGQPPPEARGRPWP